jgi:RNA polymerase sigma-70 factor (ECF subfamily)
MSFDKKESRLWEMKIYEECHLRLYHISYGILKNRLQAEEIMHDTLIRYFDIGDHFPSKKDRDKWLTRVCINFSIDQLRKNITEYKNLNKEELLAEFTKDLSSQSIQESENEIINFNGVTANDLKKIIRSLPLGYRVIITLVLFEGYDYQEISQITGLKESTVRSQYARAKAKVIESLKQKRKI